MTTLLFLQLQPGRPSTAEYTRLLVSGEKELVLGCLYYLIVLPWKLSTTKHHQSLLLTKHVLRPFRYFLVLNRLLFTLVFFHGHLLTPRQNYFFDLPSLHPEL